MRRSARLLAATSRGVKLEISSASTHAPPPPVFSASFAAISTSKFPVKAEKIASDGWTSLCSTDELSCALTLESGQVFAWRRHPKESATWLGVVGRRVFALRERDDLVQFRCLHPSDLPTKEGVDELSHYFRLDVAADPLYERWTKPTDRMTEIISRLRGLRIVRQDPVECLFSFICSSNNNIARIQGMVDKLKATYGDLLYQGEDEHQKEELRYFYAFPSVDTLAATCEEATLRALGFGYRAAFVVKTAKQLQELGGGSYLYDIRDGKSAQPKVKKLKASKSKDGQDDGEPSYHAYQDELMVFAGVGRKVADCVALFSLEKLEAIPVDTHVWQIACRELDATLSDRKSITPTVYRIVGDLFRIRFSPQAGWAHSVLFAGDLSAFKPDVPGGGDKKSKANRTNAKRKPKTTTAKATTKRKASTTDT
ncbi:8-oxoguanine glycosylase ogg1 [Phytophthora pseudosyringae]|uniref:DNA-(apurinic or apyrimidinic site) lyase n=1 Tax=Phytophthora pseudosyringae TaxID=221518 RepID=A0A8T1VVV6_9STRA|nr:8-oxoguanine glycosylase ogg1 [Phytophthora pseudosyringae]